MTSNVSSLHLKKTEGELMILNPNFLLIFSTLKNCEIRNILKKLCPFYRVKLSHAIWNRKVDTTEKKMQLESFSLTKLSNAGALEYALQDAPKSTFYGTMGLIQS